MEARLKTSYGSQIQGKKIKEQGAVGSVARETILPFGLPGVVVDPLQVWRSSAQTWTVVNKLAVISRAGKLMKGTVLWSNRSETYSTRVEGQASISADKSRIRAHFLFLEILRQVNFQRQLEEVTFIVIAPFSLSLTCERALLHSRHGKSAQDLRGSSAGQSS